MTWDALSMETMSLNDVCELLKITQQTGRNRLSMGMPMPPNFQVVRRRLFITEEVLCWIKQQSGVDERSMTVAPENYPPLLRGRPRKTTSALNKK